MATYVLIHGAGDVAWYWHLVSAGLRERGHDVVAVDLPCEDESAGWSDYADTVVNAIGDRSGEIVVVAQSLGGFTAPLVCARKRADLLVLVAGMIPAPGESPNEYWKATGYAPKRDLDLGDPIAVFYHDVPGALAEEAVRHGRRQAESIGDAPWPLDAWPAVPVRFLLCRDDRLFPAAWLRGVVRERLGITPDEIDGGHCPALARPAELVDRLETFRAR